MPRGFEGERESERANDPSGGGGGSKSGGGSKGSGGGSKGSGGGNQGGSGNNDKPSDNVSVSPPTSKPTKPKPTKPKSSTPKFTGRPDDAPQPKPKTTTTTKPKTTTTTKPKTTTTTDPIIKAAAEYAQTAKTTPKKQGRQDGPGSVTEGNQPSGLDALVNKINQDIDAGINVYADSYQLKNAEDILANVYGDKEEEFGIVSPSVAQRALAGLGYDTDKSFATNVYDNVVPGKNTPLGILSAVPSIAGLSKASQLAVTIANRLMANQDTSTPITDTLVPGLGTIIQPIRFTGRPDDAPPPESVFLDNFI